MWTNNREKWMWKQSVLVLWQRDIWWQHTDFAAPESWGFWDVHLPGCEFGWPGEQNLHRLYSRLVFHPLALFICVKFLSDFFTVYFICGSTAIYFWWDHHPQRGAGHTGQRRDAGVSGSRKPPASDQLAEEWASAAPQSPRSPPLRWLFAEVS